MTPLPPMESDFESSNVHSIGYDEPNQLLFVRFWQMSKSKRSYVPGPIYKYYGVDKRVFLQFYYAPSKGKFVWERLRERYRYTKVGRAGWRGPRVSKSAKSVSHSSVRKVAARERRQSRSRKPAAAR